MSKQSRVPDLPEENPELLRFLDSIDRRQSAMAAVSDVGGGAVLADVIAKLNEILATQRTR